MVSILHSPGLFFVVPFTPDCRKAVLHRVQSLLLFAVRRISTTLPVHCAEHIGTTTRRGHSGSAVLGRVSAHSMIITPVLGFWFHNIPLCLICFVLHFINFNALLWKYTSLSRGYCFFLVKSPRFIRFLFPKYSSDNSSNKQSKSNIYCIKC